MHDCIQMDSMRLSSTCAQPMPDVPEYTFTFIAADGTRVPLTLSVDSVQESRYLRAAMNIRTLTGAVPIATAATLQRYISYIAFRCLLRRLRRELSATSHTDNSGSCSSSNTTRHRGSNNDKAVSTSLLPCGKTKQSCSGLLGERCCLRASDQASDLGSLDSDSVSLDEQGDVNDTGSDTGDNRSTNSVQDEEKDSHNVAGKGEIAEIARNDDLLLAALAAHYNQPPPPLYASALLTPLEQHLERLGARTDAELPRPLQCFCSAGEENILADTATFSNHASRAIRATSSAPSRTVSDAERHTGDVASVTGGNATAPSAQRPASFPSPSATTTTTTREAAAALAARSLPSRRLRERGIGGVSADLVMAIKQQPTPPLPPPTRTTLSETAHGIHRSIPPPHHCLPSQQQQSFAQIRTSGCAGSNRTASHHHANHMRESAQGCRDDLYGLRDALDDYADVFFMQRAFRAPGSGAPTGALGGALPSEPVALAAAARPNTWTTAKDAAEVEHDAEAGSALPSTMYAGAAVMSTLSTSETPHTSNAFSSFPTSTTVPVLSVREQTQLLELMALADFMGDTHLMNLCGVYMSSWLMGSSEEEIVAAFEADHAARTGERISCALTPDEELGILQMIQRGSAMRHELY